MVKWGGARLQLEAGFTQLAGPTYVELTLLACCVMRHRTASSEATGAALCVGLQLRYKFRKGVHWRKG